MLQGDWGFSFVSRDRRRHADPAAPADDAARHRLVADPGAADRAAGRRLRRDAALFDLRPDRQHARLHRLLAADLLHRAAVHPAVRDQLDWLPFVYRADLGATGWRWCWEQFQQSIMPIVVLGLFQGARWTRYVRSAVLDVIRLDYVTTARAKGLGERVVIIKHVVRNALIPVVTLVALQMPGGLRRRHRHRADLPRPRHRLAADQRDPRQRHAGHHGGDLRLRLPRGPVQPDCGLLYGWLDPRITYR